MVVEVDPVPGMVPRPDYMKSLGKSDFTGRRWQAEGRIVVHYIGKTPYVDVAATAARLRGEGRAPRRRLPASAG